MLSIDRSDTPICGYFFSRCSSKENHPFQASKMRNLKMPQKTLHFEKDERNKHEKTFVQVHRSWGSRCHTHQGGPLWSYGAMGRRDYRSLARTCIWWKPKLAPLVCCDSIHNLLVFWRMNSRIVSHSYHVNREKGLSLFDWSSCCSFSDEAIEVSLSSMMKNEPWPRMALSRSPNRTTTG